MKPFCITLKAALEFLPKRGRLCGTSSDGAANDSESARGANHFQRFLPLVLGRLRNQQPNLLLTAKIVRPTKIATSLKTGVLEIALGPHPIEAPELQFAFLCETTLEIVVLANHRWAAQGGVPAKELAKEPCFLPDKSHSTRHLIDGHFAAQNTVIDGVSDIENLDVIKEMPRRGFGMSILPKWVVKEELKAGIFTAFPPGRRDLRQSWRLLRLRGRPVTAIENSLQMLCAEATKSLQSAP